MELIQRTALIALGGALGSCLRFELGRLVASRAGTAFPWGTLLINVAGSFVIGLFLTVGLERVEIDPRWRFLVATGFCGGFTTFSAFTYETMKLVDERSYLLAAANVAGSSILGLVAVFAGAALARKLA